MRLAFYTAHMSDDPSTQNSAVIVHTDNQRTVAVNGVPAKLDDTNRYRYPAKASFVEHAERAVIYKAAERGRSTRHSTMISPWACCPECARAIISAGVVQLFVHGPLMKEQSRWTHQIVLGHTMLKEAGIKIVNVNMRFPETEPISFGGEMWQP